MKNSDIGFAHENIAKVAYMIGYHSGQLEFADWDEIILAAETIVNDWVARIDIQSEEEFAYIMKYAERVLFTDKYRHLRENEVE
jgi:hypothetical protein